MTHLTQEAQSRRQASAQNRAKVRDALMNGLFTPYTFLSLVLVLGGVAVAMQDAKGIPVLIIAATVAAVIRLLYTTREELRQTNEQQRLLLRHLAQRDAGK